MNRIIVCLASFLVLIGYALPIQAQPAPTETTGCAFTFKAGKDNTFLQFCVTANGNIPQIETPSGHLNVGAGGEGYGICNESPSAEYHDYASGASGNWGTATVLSKTGASVKIARTTSDGHWALTQTIGKVAKTSSITIVMALTNNQAVDKQAYLIRYADVNADGHSLDLLGATGNSAFAWSYSLDPPPPFYGLQLQNVGTPQFGFWSAEVQSVNLGPNPCDLGAHDAQGSFNGDGSFVLAYIGPVPAGQTKTATMTYRGL
jgi:hypothetical protein